MRTVRSVKVRSHDATLLHETMDSVSMEHCSTLFQAVASVSNNVGLRELGAHRQLLSRCRRGRVREQCSTGQSRIVWIDLQVDCNANAAATRLTT